MASRWFPSRHVRRDYSRKRYANPLFTPGPSGHGRGRRWFVRLVVLAVAVGWLWFLGFSGALRIIDIEVRGNDQVPAWEIRDAVEEVLAGRAWLVLPKRSVLFASEDEIAAALTERFVLESAEVTKRPPHGLEVAVKERVSSILLQMPDGSQALLDLNGAVMRTFRPEEAVDVVRRAGPSLDEGEGRRKKEYHVLHDDRDEAFRLRDQAVGADVVAAAIALPNLIKERFGDAPFLQELRIDGAKSTTLRAVMSEGWTIYLDAAQPLEGQVTNAEIVLRTKVGADRPRLDYIDVRFGEKVFFKLKD